MKFKKCEVCKEYHWTDDKCQPEYFVYHEEYLGDESKTIRATNHEDAALKYGQYYNTQNDYVLINDSTKVKVEKDGVIKFFEIGAEPDVHYTSNEIKTLD